MKPAWQLLGETEENPVAGYRSQAREDVLKLVRRAPRLVLELGCGVGATGALLKQTHPGARVIGIEPHGPSAKEAAGRLDQVFAAKLEDVDLAAEGVAPGSVDLVLAADVLEHMVDPWRALRSLHPFLAPEARIVASLPNVRNLNLVTNLADKGRWPYAAEGLLDITHLRFFTRREMVALFEDSGYQVKRQVFMLDGGFEKLYEANKDKPAINVRRGRMTLTGLTQEEFMELCSVQILTIAVPAAAQAAAPEGASAG